MSRHHLISSQSTEKLEESGGEPDDPVECLRTVTIPYQLESGPIERIETNKSLPEYPESIFGTSKLELAWFMLVIGSMAMISQMCVPSFFATITTLADYFDESVENINVTATVYSIFQGISPLFWATLSDSVGRRPIYICSVAICIAANFSLANINNYASLLGLRILQAFGGASTVSLQSAVMGDITTRRNRGGIVGIITGFSSLGNCFGPLIGGAILHTWDWRAVFWFLGIHASTVWLIFIVTIPETNRHFVGNGSIIPKGLIYQSVTVYIKRKLNGVPYKPSDSEYDKQWMPPPHKTRYFSWLYLIRQVDVILVLIPNALTYTTWYMVLTALSTTLSSRNHFNTLKVGYTYLASGIGTFVASIFAGKIMNSSYIRALKSYEKHCEEQGKTFHRSGVNIYKARLEPTAFAMVVMVVFTITYGWTLHYDVTYYVPVVMTFFVSYGATFFLSASTVILVDLFPDDAAASTSCVNLTRCCLCAVGLAVVDRMMHTMGIGGTFTLMGGLCGVSWICIWLELVFGKKLAKKRMHKEKLAASKVKSTDSEH